MFKKRYRIMPDTWAGYEIQVKTWWFPFWRLWNFSNTYGTYERAENKVKEIISRHKIYK